MKTLKKIGVGFIGLILLLVVIAFFLPKETIIERKIEINAPAKAVFVQVNELRNWEKWSKWHTLDPDAEYTYSEPSHGLDAWYSWRSENENVGNGKLTTTVFTPYSFLEQRMDFEGMGSSTAYWKFEENAGVTHVTWGFKNDNGWNPIGRWVGIMMDKLLGPDYEYGLEHLKLVAESESFDANDVMVTKMDHDIVMLALKDSGDVNELGQKYAALFGRISTFMTENNIEAVGAPIVRTHVWNPPFTMFEAGIQVNAGDYKLKDGIELVSITAGNIATYTHLGSYENLEESYNKIADFLAENKLETIGGPWEVYITDPMAEKDTSKWITQISFPIP